MKMRCTKLGFGNMHLVAMLVLAMILPSIAFAQDRGITIAVITGRGAVHHIGRDSESPTIVEVRDSNSRPIDGARVTFSLPGSGPSADFADGSRVVTKITDRRGRAVVAGLIPNRREGPFDLEVSASVGGQTAVPLMIAQSNVSGEDATPRVNRKIGTRVLLVVAAGAAAAGLGIMLSHGGGSGGAASSGSGATSTQPTTVSIGTISIGSPR